MWYIYGAGDNGKRICGKFKSEIEGFIDKYNFGADCCELPVVSPEEMYEKDCSASILVSIMDKVVAHGVVVELLKKGFMNLYLYNSGKNLDSKAHIEDIAIPYKNVLPTLPYLEYQVSDRCNLNCKGCSHFSNLIRTDVFPTIDSFEKELKRLKDIFSNIEVFRLMGGEPLLNCNLHQFVKTVREYFPQSDIRIVTNGLLICSIKQELIDAVRATNASFDISYYPILDKNIDRIQDFLRKNSINYVLSSRVEQFFVNMSRNNEDYQKSFDEFCHSKSCHFLRNGKMYICPRIPMAYENQAFLGLDISEEEMKLSSINIFKDMDGWEILGNLCSAVPACKICTKIRMIDWELSKGDVNPDEFFA